MPLVSRIPITGQLRSRALALGSRTVIMGILNVTPDSFSDGGRFRAAEEAVAAACRMLDEGAAIVDIGGESTRPGDYDKVSAAEESDRVLPVIEGIIRERPDALLSIDTYQASTARCAIKAGVEIVNDVSGFLWDAAMAPTCADLACGVILMHTRGRPAEWKSLPALSPAAVVPLVLSELRERLANAQASGIDLERILVDPGFGFGKRGGENYPLLAHLDALLALGRPILAGLSRKGCLAPERPPREREAASIAASAVAILHGASILRVHDVKAAVEAAAVVDAVVDTVAEAAASAISA